MSRFMRWVVIDAISALVFIASGLYTLWWLHFELASFLFAMGFFCLKDADEKLLREEIGIARQALDMVPPRT